MIIIFSCRSSCLSVWVRGIGRHHYILRDIPIDTQCSNIYSLVSSLSGVPSKMLILSNGSKFLQPRRPLHSSLSQVNLSHGVNLHCYIKILSGDGGDEVGGVGCEFTMYHCPCVHTSTQGIYKVGYNIRSKLTTNPQDCLYLSVTLTSKLKILQIIMWNIGMA